MALLPRIAGSLELLNAVLQAWSIISDMMG
jgi:hypothetical protein